jgi:hypothetical protein
MVCFEILYLINENEKFSDDLVIAKSKKNWKLISNVEQRSNLLNTIQKLIRKITTGFASFGR